MLKLAKNLIFILTFTIICLFLIPEKVDAAGNAIMRLTSAKTDYEVGETVYIDIEVELNGEEINVARAVMNFTGGNVLHINDFNLGTTLPYLSPGSELDNVNNVLNVGGFILMSGVTQDFLFGTLIFQANETGSSALSFADTSHLISPQQEEKIYLLGCQGITINVLPPPNNAPSCQVNNKSIVLGETWDTSFSCVDQDNDNITIDWNPIYDPYFSNVVSGPNASVDFSFTGIQLGTYNFSFNVYDNNPTDPITIIKNIQVQVVENNPPVFQSVSDKNIEVNETVSFQVVATDPNGDDVVLTADIPVGATFTNVSSGTTASGTFSWTPTQEGVFNLLFTATDDNPTDPKINTMDVIITVAYPPNNMSNFIAVSEQIVNISETVNFNVSATDPDGDNVFLEMPLFENANFNIITTGVTSTGSFTWKPTASGVYYVLFKATDDNPNSLTREMTVRITVLGGQCPPCGGGGGSYTCPTCTCQEIIYEPDEKEVEKKAPIVISPTHPNSEKWYANNKPQFVWEVEEDGQGFIFNLDENHSFIPEIAYFSSHDKMFSFTEVNDGFWYFHIKTKYENGYGPATHYPIKIDTTPPEFFKPRIETKKIANGLIEYWVYFSSIDMHSGLAFYEIKIDDASSWTKVESPIILNTLEENGKILTIRAIDNAGNAIESYIDIVKSEIIEKESEIYLIEKEQVIVDRPKIDQVITPKKIGEIFVKNALVVTGKATPYSMINLHIARLEDNTEKVYSTNTNSVGIWEIYIDEGLDIGNYSLYAIAKIGDANSIPSEMVHLTLTEPYEPDTEIELADWLQLMSWLIFFIAGFLMYMIIKYLRNLINKHDKRKNKHNKYKKKYQKNK